MNTLEFDQRLEDILKSWQEIELDIKKSELLSNKVSIPAINELRYAGRAIIRAIVSSRKIEDKIFDDAIATAQQYLTNAAHDVVDSSVLFVGRRVDELNYRFGGSQLPGIIRAMTA